MLIGHAQPLPRPCPPSDYVDFLTSVTPENQEEFMMQASLFFFPPFLFAWCWGRGLPQGENQEECMMQASRLWAV